jgi:hypothetical protein
MHKCVGRVDGLLPWFEAMLNDRGLMALLLHFWQRWCKWSSMGDGSGYHWQAGFFFVHLFRECLAQLYELATIDEEMS